MDEMKYSVLVVDDHPLMRKGIVQLLELEDNIEVIGEASNGTDAVAMAKESEPDLILLDLNMKGLSGLDTLKALRAEEVTSRVVILTVSDARQDVVALLKAGADGYLLKDTEPDMLLGQLADVMTGKQILSEPLRPYLENIYELDHLQQKLESLTRREMQNHARDCQGSFQQAGRLRAPHLGRHRQGARQEPAEEARSPEPGGSRRHVPGAAQLRLPCCPPTHASQGPVISGLFAGYSTAPT